MTLALLGLAAIGLPRSPAQMHYSGGFVPYRKNPTSTLRPAPPPSSQTPLTPSASPDHDFYFPTFSSPMTTVARSYYAPSGAGQSLPSFGVSAAALPWDQPGFEAYRPSAATSSAPREYVLAAASLSRGLPAAKAGPALLIVHLPENAMLWVEGKGIPLQGPTSYFNSPPLQPGEDYDYAVGTAWLEGSRLVSLTREVTVEAGSIQALYVRPSVALVAQKEREARIEAALAKLSPRDREAARRQRTCVIRKDVRLGECGVPVKVMLDRQYVFVCCDSCVKPALADPKLALARAEALRGKDAPNRSSK